MRTGAGAVQTRAPVWPLLSWRDSRIPDTVKSRMSPPLPSLTETTHGYRPPGGRTEGIYLDYNGSAPLDPRVAEVMTRALTEGLGNASSIHRFGRRQAAAADEAREHVAALVGGRAAGAIFTSGATDDVARFRREVPLRMELPSPGGALHRDASRRHPTLRRGSRDGHRLQRPGIHGCDRDRRGQAIGVGRRCQRGDRRFGADHPVTHSRTRRAARPGRRTAAVPSGHGRALVFPRPKRAADA